MQQCHYETFACERCKIPLPLEVVARSAGVVSATHGRIFVRKNIGDRLPTLPRRPSVATPSKKGEFCTAFDLNFLHQKQREFRSKCGIYLCK